MSATLDQIFISNPITVNASTDLMYFSQSPYTPGHDAGMTFANFKAQFVSATGILSPANGGTGVNNGTNTLTLGGNLTTSGAFATTFTFAGATSVTFPTSGTLATTSSIPSLPLSLANGGTGAALTANNGGIFYSNASTGAILAGTATAQQLLMSGASTTPQWSITAYPLTNAINTIMYASSANILGVITPVNNGVMISGTTGVPSWLANSGTAGFVLTANTGAPPSWQAAASSGITTIDGNSGSVTPSAGVVTISGGTTGLTTSGSSSTLTLTGTLNVANGGTGTTSVNAYGLICGGTTSTGGFQSISATGTSGQILISEGAGFLPQWGPASDIAIVNLEGDDTTIASGGTVEVSGGSTGLTTTAAGTRMNLVGLLNLAHGGLNANLTASNGGIFYSTGSAGAILAGTATAGQLLSSGASSTPQWSTTTYPLTNAINTIMYASSANALGSITAANNGVLITSATGVPSWLAAGTTGQVLTATTGSPPSWGASSGSGTVSSGLINQLAYYAAAGTTVSGVTIVNSAVLTTTSGGVPTWVVSTGTGAPVLATSPTLITPTLGASTATSLAFSPTTGGIIGTTAADSASSGTVGQIISSSIASGSSVSFTTATAKDVTSISLTAGDWDVYGNVTSTVSVSFTQIIGWISTSSATTPDSSLYTGLAAGSALSENIQFCVPFVRINVSSTTIVYLSAKCTFTAGTITCCGTLFARRAR